MHTWKFYRTGGLDQVLIRNGADIAHLKELDQKLWTVLSCPAKGLRFDQKTLDLLDIDGDGRIRVPELLGAIQWLSVRLVSLDTLMEGAETLRLSAFNTQTSEGMSLLASAKRILSNLGKASSETISLENVTDTSKFLLRPGLMVMVLFLQTPLMMLQHSRSLRKSLKRLARKWTVVVSQG
jgi:hypothetical protein